MADDLVMPEDGSTDAGAEALSRIDVRLPEEIEAENAARTRGDDGKFKAPETDDDAAPVRGANDKRPSAEAATADDEDDDFIEVPADAEGDEPKRIKLADAIDRYNRFETVERELQTAKQGVLPPEQYDIELQNLMQHTAKMARGLEYVQQFITPREPSLDMLNPNSATYDPNGYYTARSTFETQLRDLNLISAERQRLADEQRQQEAALGQTRHARERDKLLKMWPDIAKLEVAQDVRTKLGALYGIGDKDLHGIIDSRLYAVIKDALTLRAQQQTEAKVAKVVAGKPKLVRSAARQSGNAARDSAKARFLKSRSVDDAADLIKALNLT